MSLQWPSPKQQCSSAAIIPSIQGHSHQCQTTSCAVQLLLNDSSHYMSDYSSVTTTSTVCILVYPSAFCDEKAYGQEIAASLHRDCKV